MSPQPPKPVEVRVLGFDFEKREERELGLSEIFAAMEHGTFVWVDVEVRDQEAARALLCELSLISLDLIDEALTRHPETKLARYDGYLHFAVRDCSAETFDSARLDCALGARFLLSIHRSPIRCLEAARKVYRHDFQRFARSPSFLVYELWDQLAEQYSRVQESFEDRVEVVQRELMQDVDDDEVFARVSTLSADLLNFRKLVLPARAALSDLSTRRSPYLSETTQRLLGNVVGSVERVLQDVLVDRDILAEALNSYMSLVSHRTNRVMKRLTVVNIVFLPLTFLCGVYGMNFEYLPELRWQYGYPMFWLTVAAIVLAIAWVSKRARLL
ncbi:MAG TPA: magnesium transporter CorA family protein [Polyangiales bacterium]|nr:magnesium transporter CorA family protein [Polyangiales bacterium]